MKLLDKYLLSGAHFQAPDAPSSPGGAGPDVAASGASPTPAPAPSSPDPAPSSTQPDSPTTPSDSDSGAGADSFDFMFGEGPGQEEGDPVSPFGVPTTEPQAAAPQTQQPAPVQPAPQAPAAVVPPQPGPAQPATAQSDATSQPAPQVQLDPFDPGMLAQHLVQNEQAIIQHLATNDFALSREDVEALETDVVGTVPRLLARAFVKSQQNFLIQMGRVMPQMIQRHGEVSKRHAANEAKFYARWPDIKADNEAHSKAVLQYAGVYRQMHPQTSLDEMIEAVGPMVMMAQKISPTPVVPGAPVVRSPMAVPGVRPPQPSPFMPAGPASGGASPVFATVDNISSMFQPPDEQ